MLYGFLLFLFAPTREMNVQHPLQLAYSRGLVCPLVYILVPEKPRITATVPLLYCRVRVYVWCLTILTHNETARTSLGQSVNQPPHRRVIRQSYIIFRFQLFSPCQETVWTACAEEN